MKKLLTIYVDDDCTLEMICGTFVMFDSKRNSSITMINEKIPGDAKGIYFPFKKLHDSDGTIWISQEQE